MSDYKTNSKSMFASLENNSGFGHIYDNNKVNPYFNWVSDDGEQTLNDMLVAEAIINRGVECVYIRRTLQNVDLVFGEDPTSKFERHFRAAIYVESFDGWEGDGDWYSKFGFQVEDEMNVSINPNLFARQGDGEKPLSGDLIYFPLSKGLFEISWVEPEDPWYQTGQLAQRKLKLAKFDYSGEEMSLESVAPHIDTIDDLINYTENQEQEELDSINNLNGRWDNGIEQGKEMEQVENEVDEFFIDDQVVPPGTGLPEEPTPTEETPPTIGWNISNNISKP